MTLNANGRDQQHGSTTVQQFNSSTNSSTASIRPRFNHPHTDPHTIRHSRRNRTQPSSVVRQEGKVEMKKRSHDGPQAQLLIVHHQTRARLHARKRGSTRLRNGLLLILVLYRRRCRYPLALQRLNPRYTSRPRRRRRRLTGYCCRPLLRPLRCPFLPIQPLGPLLQPIIMTHEILWRLGLFVAIRVKVVEDAAFVARALFGLFVGIAGEPDG